MVSRNVLATLENDINGAGDAIFEPLHLATSSLLDQIVKGDIQVDDLTEDGTNELIREIQGKHRQSIAPEGL